MYMIGGNIFSINRIMRFTYHKRLFMIFDRTLPYELTINYYQPKASTNFIFVKTIKPITQYNFRFKNKNECLKCINDINRKKIFISFRETI